MERGATTNDVQPLESSLASFFNLALEISRSMVPGISKMQLVRDFADDLERTPEFTQPLRTVSTLDRTEVLRKRITGEDKITLGTFLRRSGVYLALHTRQLRTA
jgi:hypothetical protein